VGVGVGAGRSPQARERSRRQEARSRKQEAGCRRQEAGCRRQEAGGRKRGAGGEEENVLLLSVGRPDIPFLSCLEFKYESPAKRSFHRRDAEYAEIILM
jgi:hypothetical protein